MNNAARTAEKVAQVAETAAALRTAILENRREEAEALLVEYFRVAAEAGLQASL